MRMPKISLFAILAGALTLVACGDGSVRSPGLVGGGELQRIELRCVRSDGGQCSDPARVNVGSTVNFRVIGFFEDGSNPDITALDRIEFAIQAPDGEAEFVVDEKGRVRGLSPTDAGAVTITASDAEGEGGSARLSWRSSAAFPRSSISSPVRRAAHRPMAATLPRARRCSCARRSASSTRAVSR